MNKISIYILLILVYLGLSKAFSPHEQATLYIDNEQTLTNYFAGAPISVILLKVSTTGYFIKTYYLHLKLVHGFRPPEYKIIRASHRFYKKAKNYVGLSIFRRSETEQFESTVPLPPGSLFLGNQAYGNWELMDSGQRRWFFYRPYKHFPRIFGWSDFRPSYEFYQKLKIHAQERRPYFGLHNEFGPDGKITKELLREHFNKKEDNKFSLKSYFNRILSTTSYWMNYEPTF